VSRRWLLVALLAACSSGNGGVADKGGTPVEAPADPPATAPADPPATAPADPPATAPADPTTTPPGTSAPADAAAAGDGLERARQRARDALAEQHPDAAIEVAALPGPGGVQIVRARDPKARPGSGVAALIYDPDTGATYGKRGERDLAELVRARGWLVKPLPEADLIKLVHEAQFDGVLILRDAAVDPAPGGGLRVILPVHTMRGALRRTWIVTLPESGELRVGEGP
jgi:pyruvate/2-oxoglutarate dehydrogenase complex dihydrolipoamide acyltransferase (E2) component